MDEPVGRGLRPARRSGLTSPEQVTHPDGRRPPRTPDPTRPGNTDKPQNKPAAAQARPKTSPQRRKPETVTPGIHSVDRGSGALYLNNPPFLAHSSPTRAMRAVHLLLTFEAQGCPHSCAG
jgi:hypothetical protein